MKKRWTEPEFLRQQRVREARAERGRRRLTSSYQASVKALSSIVAPKVLSVFDNPEETISFCNSFRGLLTSRHNGQLFVDLSAVERVSTDALLLTRAIMKTAGQHSSIRGNLPTVREVAAKIKASGFFSGLARPPGDLPEPAGMMRDSSERLVVNTLAAGMVEFAQMNSDISQVEADASYQTLMELMSNTHHHAGGALRESPSGVPEQARWFAIAYCQDRGAYFTIADIGVGILKSPHALGFLRRLSIGIGAYGQARLLSDAFEGKIGSSTGEPGRGKGLPKMLEDARGFLPDLRVLTSSVMGRVSTLDFNRLALGFRGTIFRWSAGQKRSEL